MLAIDADAIEIASLISKGRYSIPRFQRPYAWGEEEITEFWEDLLRLQGSEFFLGAMVVNSEHLKTHGAYDIIDGQQRLVTLLIFVTALRDVFRAKRLDKLASVLDSQVLRTKDLCGDEHPRVKISDTAHPFFVKNLLNRVVGPLDKPVDKETSLLVGAYNYFYNVLTRYASQFEKDMKQQEKKLSEIRDSLFAIRIVLISIKSENDAYEIFEALNAKGLDLSVADLLKNLIFKNYKPVTGLDSAKIIWDGILKLLGKKNADVVRFVRYYWLSEYEFIREKNLYSVIRRQITDYADFLNTLNTEAQVFASLNNPQIEEWKEFRTLYSRARTLELLRLKQYQALLLAGFRQYRAKKINHKQFEALMGLIESFTFVFTISDRSAVGVEKMYSKLAKKLKEADTNSFARVFADIRTEIQRRVPKYAEFESGFMELDYESSKNLCTHILTEINIANDKPGIAYNDKTIEHILPINPKDKKNKKHPFIHKIGNLTLLTLKDNDACENKTFADKLPIYAKSGFPLTKEIAKKHHSWGETEIALNAKSMAKFCFENRWKF